jgi:hypothetical protein
MSKKCKKRDVFAVQTGDYAGQMFIVVDVNKDHIGCLSVPTMENVKIPFNSFETGRNNDIIKFVEQLPREVYKVSEAQYNKNNENANN